MPHRPENPQPALAPTPPRIIWVAFLVRITYMTLAHTYRFREYAFGHHFAFGFEMGRIGQALATGYGFADPFIGHTGPTAWVGPLYPLLIGGVFKLFGVYTLKSAWILLAINCALCALIVPAVWEIAFRCFNQRVALWSAWIWALHPAAMQYAVRWVWETTLTTLLFSWVLVLALRMRNIGGDPDHADSAMTTRRWACFGLLWGLIALSNASLALFLPFCGLWILAGAKQWKRQIPGVLLSSLLCLACIAPWTYRNWLVFHQFVPLRGNLGAELYLGNGPDANGLLMEYNHPNESLSQLALYTKMGEIPYAKYRGHLAMTYIRSNPGELCAAHAQACLLFLGWSSPSAGPLCDRIRSQPELRFRQPRRTPRPRLGAETPRGRSNPLRASLPDRPRRLLLHYGSRTLSSPAGAAYRHPGRLSLPVCHPKKRCQNVTKSASRCAKTCQNERSILPKIGLLPRFTRISIDPDPEALYTY